MKKSLLLAVLVFKISGTVHAIPIGIEIQNINTWSMESQQYFENKLAYYGIRSPLNRVNLSADASALLVGMVDDATLQSCKKNASEPATMIFLGAILIGLSKFGKKILTPPDR